MSEQLSKDDSWNSWDGGDHTPAGVGEFEFVDVQVNGQVILCTPADKINWVETSAWRRSN